MSGKLHERKEGISNECCICRRHKVGYMALCVSSNVEDLDASASEFDRLPAGDLHIEPGDLIRLFSGSENLYEAIARVSMPRTGSFTHHDSSATLQPVRCFSSSFPPAWSWWWCVLKMCVSLHPLRSSAARIGFTCTARTSISLPYVRVAVSTLSLQMVD